MENCPTDPHEPKQELDDPLMTTNFNTTGDDDSLNDLCKNMNQCLKIEDVQENNNGIKKKKLGEERNVEDYNEEEEEEEEDLTEALLVQMGYWKPEPKKPPPPLPRLASPDAGFKLVSALKGSRKKEGMQVEERRISWAPDVYDPVPKSPEHFWTSRTVRQRSESKKSVKNKQKWSGKASGVGGGGGKGGKEKDKKQVKRYGGSASKYFDALDDDETLVDGGDRYAGYDKYY